MTAYRVSQLVAPNVLICSGLDPTGGAGFIADTRVVMALGGRPVGVVTALTIQNTIAVQQMTPVDPDFFGGQLGTLLGDVEVGAVKLGLLGSPRIAQEIGYGLDRTSAPVVWDPIGQPSRGRVEFDARGFDEILDEIKRHLTLITPNVMELEQLTNKRILSREDAIGAAKKLIDRVGEIAVLVKGGHWADAPKATDILVDGKHEHDFDGEWIGKDDVHGTGCALSTAIATHLAHGKALPEACREAKDFVAAHIAAAVRPGRGAPAVV
jgi:hydroxymethylpyrimidine/phosphomethylpyrimidine kinase